MNLTLSSYIETNKSSYFKFLSQANQRQNPHLFVNWFTKTALPAYSLDLIPNKQHKAKIQPPSNRNLELDFDFER